MSLAFFWRKKWAEFIFGWLLSFLLICMCQLFIVLIFLPGFIEVVGYGVEGVIYRRFLYNDIPVRFGTRYF